MSEPARKTPEHQLPSPDTLMMVSHDAILIVDARLITIHANQSAADLLDVLPDETIGLPLRQFLPAALCDRVAALPVRGEPVQAVEDWETTSIQHPDGVSIPVTVRMAQDHASGCLVVALRDMRPVADANARLAAVQDEANASLRARFGFLAAMSHELRTPLNGILGFSEIMARETMGPIGKPEYRDYAQTIHDAGKHLLALISDLLDLSKIENGDISVEIRQLHIVEIIRNTVRLMQGQADAAGIGLGIHIPDPSVRLAGDQRRIGQILMNLITNSLKFTDRGGCITVSVVPTASGTDLTVTDTGIGMTKEEAVIAVEPFKQINRGRSRPHGGIGLGLPLCKQLAELHGGWLDVDSTPGAGTTVRVHFPARPTG